MKKIKVGVVGVGYFGQFHAEKYANMEEVELVGVADVDTSRAREIAQRYRAQPLQHLSLYDHYVDPGQYHHPGVGINPAQ